MSRPLIEPRTRCVGSFLGVVCLLALAACQPTRPSNEVAFAEPETSAICPEVIRVGYTVADVESTSAFFQDVLDFELLRRPEVDAIPDAPGRQNVQRSRVARLRLGREEIELTEYSPSGRPIPNDSASNDLWFEHVAIVVSDMHAAHRRLMEHGVQPVSTGGPQTIPESNPAAGGIRAFYFRDPEDHVLEIIWYPGDKGLDRWHSQERLFLGIDHTAIAVADTARSLEFYQGLLGFRKAGESLNSGPEQEALSGVKGARVEITGLAGCGGPGVEFLRYLAPGPGRPAPTDTRLQDAWHWEITIATRDAAAVVTRADAMGALWSAKTSVAPLLIHDPDRHVLRVLQTGEAQ